MRILSVLLVSLIFLTGCASAGQKADKAWCRGAIKVTHEEDGKKDIIECKGWNPFAGIINYNKVG